MEKAIERTKALLSNRCCDELKNAARAWLDSIGTDKEKEVGRKYILELKDSIVTVNGKLAFLPTDEAKALSYGLPRLDIDGVMPYDCVRLKYACDVY